ncbi:unnamed protein product, partial [Urochloa humidicola]
PASPLRVRWATREPPSSPPPIQPSPPPSAPLPALPSSPARRRGGEKGRGLKRTPGGATTKWPRRPRWPAPDPPSATNPGNGHGRRGFVRGSVVLPGPAQPPPPPCPQLFSSSMRAMGAHSPRYGYASVWTAGPGRGEEDEDRRRPDPGKARSVAAWRARPQLRAGGFKIDRNHPGSKVAVESAAALATAAKAFRPHDSMYAYLLRAYLLLLHAKQLFTIYIRRHIQGQI